MARMIGLPLVLLTIANSPPTVFIPPPIMHPPAFTQQASENRGLLMWMPGEVRCDGGAAPRVETLRRPYNSMLFASTAAPSPSPWNLRSTRAAALTQSPSDR